MRRLQKTKPSGRGLGIALPLTQGHYYPMQGNMYYHHDDLLGAALDTDEWASSAGGSATITVTGSLATITGSTASAATIAARFWTIESGAQNVFYTIPFRVDILARLDVLASGGHHFFRIRDTAAVHVAQFELTGTAITVATGLSCSVYAGQTDAAYIATAQCNFFATAGAAMTAFNHYVIEMTHRGVWFGIQPTGAEAPKQLKWFGAPLPRHDKNYVVEIRHDILGTAETPVGTKQTLDVDSVSVEMLAPMIQSERVGQNPGTDLGAVRTLMLNQTMVTNAIALATTGSGVFLGWSYTTTAVTELITDTLVALDASANNIFGNSDTAQAKILWMQPVVLQSTASGAAGINVVPYFPPQGIPFFRGLVIGASNATGTAGGGSSAYNIVAAWRAQQ